MDKTKASATRSFGNRLLFYFGSGWLLVEVFNFVIERYDLDPVFLDYLILITIFGLPATIIYSFFSGGFNKIAIVLQVLNGISAIALMVFFFLNPLALNPGKLRVLKLYEGKSSALQSLNSLAVLPFTNNLGNDSQEYLLDGMHDGLINEIGQLGSIHIISKTSTLTYKNTNKSIKNIAEELKVDAIIETSLTRIDTLIELRINLVNAFPDELVLWNHSYSTSLSGLPNLYKEVTKNVALKINKALLPEEEQKLEPKRVPNPGAYEAALRGTYYMGFLTKEGFDLAEAQFRKAIKIDSLFALGYGGLAGILGSSRQMGYVSGMEVNSVLDSLSKKSYALDSLDAHILMGIASNLTWTHYEWEEAELYFKKSIEANSNMAQSRALYAHYLILLDRWTDAWEQMEYAMELDPQNPWVIAFSAAMYFNNGKMLSGLKQAKRLIQIEPNHPMANQMLLMMSVIQKNYDLAIPPLKKFVGRTGAPNLDALIDNAYQTNDFNATVKLATNYLEEYEVEHFVSPNIMCILYQMLGETDKQLEWMMKMYEVSDPNLPYYALRKGDPIEDDPTYILIMKEIGLW